MGLITLTISLLIRTFGAVQESRSPAEKPLIWSSDIAVTVLMLLWVILLIVGAYITYIDYNWPIAIAALVFYFAIAPLTVSPLLKKLLDKIGF